MVGKPGLDLSFSGLKTALRTAVATAPDLDAVRADLAAGYQRAIVASLVGRTMEAIAASGRDTLAVVGGVAANGELRRELDRACSKRGIRLAVAPLALCSDNAAMIASAARYAQPLAFPEYLSRDAYATA
jgi:N6-L-threonylcarbamoyladenine synthase